MRLDLSHIRQPETPFDKRYEPEAFGGAAEDYRVLAPVVLRMAIHKDKDRFRLVGTVKTELEIECSRAWIVLRCRSIENSIAASRLAKATGARPRTRSQTTMSRSRSIATTRSTSASCCRSRLSDPADEAASRPIACLAHSAPNVEVGVKAAGKIRDTGLKILMTNRKQNDAFQNADTPRPAAAIAARTTR